MSSRLCRWLLLVMAAAAAPAWPLLAETVGAARPPRTLSLDGQWLLATDPRNAGRQQHWFDSPRASAVPTKVPWIIQDAFPGYHGVVWYWRQFQLPEAVRSGDRVLLRFWAVDYQAEVWVNGLSLGGHEGGETPFTLDITTALRPGQTNQLAVRVLNPSNEPIDGIVLAQTPHRNKVIPYSAGSSFDQGGIVDSVELVQVPTVWIQDVFAQPDPKTGLVRIQSSLMNTDSRKASVALQVSLAPAAGGETLVSTNIKCTLAPGQTLIDTECRVDYPHLWDLGDPWLYRVSVRAAENTVSRFDERSVRFGFRDFRFADGCFRLNGKRLYLRCSHTGNHYPVGLQLPPNPDMLRRDLVNVKAMGFNAVRFIAGVAIPQQLDFCDELGLLVYEESYASWCLADSPKMPERFERSTREMVLRDRNHPSLVMWGLLNETGDGPVFREAVAELPKLRQLDRTRLVLLSSGRFDGQAIGSLSNPGSTNWEDVLGDQHHYPRTPHTADVVQKLRTLEAGRKPLFLSEYGIGSAVDLISAVRHFEQCGKTNLEDARFFQDKLDRFLADWERWRMAEVFGRPQEFFAASLRKMAGERLLGLNALRANPNLVGFSLTGTVDQGMTGEGLFTTWRELKPGTTDAIFESLAPLRWCLFVEPVHFYAGQTARLEAVLANEDALAPGDYPVSLQILGPNHERIWERHTVVKVSAAHTRPEPPFATAAFDESIAVSGPAGKYRFLAAFEQGAAATGGEAVFYVGQPASLGELGHPVVLWGEDATLARWLASTGVHTNGFSTGTQREREIILLGLRPPASELGPAFAELARHIARGSIAISLAPEVFADQKETGRWLPLAQKGSLSEMPSSIYHKDEWARPHPFFEGLPTGMLDYLYYRELIPTRAWIGQARPAEAVCGAIDASAGYVSGLMLAVHQIGAGRLVLGTLNLRQNLGIHPAADRLMQNLLQEAARDCTAPLLDLPPDFTTKLRAFGYLD